MLIPDVNVLVNSALPGAADYAAANRWLLRASQGNEQIGIPHMVLLGFARVTTGPTPGRPPSPVADVLSACSRFAAMANYVRLLEGPRHWEVFERVVTRAGISGKRLTDAYLAAFAIENDATFVTFDRGFQRFGGLNVLVPV